jgi:hypothetical protein
MKLSHRLLLPLCLVCVVGLGPASQGDGWPQTRAERTNYQETSHYEDVLAFVRALQAKGAPVSLQFLGKSTEGRDMPLVIAARPPVSTPAEARRTGRPIIFIQANIHAGEVEGKEASLAILRRACQEGPGGLLDKAILLVCPIYNIDGNEKFGPVERNRPQQGGPPLVGVRANGQGLDLNRDAIKAESPEMRGLLDHVYTTWDPDVMMDLHTTDGTRHGYDLTYAGPLNPNTESGIQTFTRDKLIPAVRKQIKQQYGMEMFDYGNVERRGDLQAYYSYGQEGRYCTHYAGLRNRIGILSEAATYIPFKDRVVATDRFVTGVLDYLLRNSKLVIELTRGADRKVTEWGLHPEKAPALGVRFEFDSRGSEHVILERPRAEGAPPRVGRPTDLVKVKMPIFDRFKVSRTARFPASYLIPADQEKAIELLRRHGVVVERLTEGWRGSVEAFTIKEVVLPANAFQGHRLIRLEGQFALATVSAPKGWYLVRTAQPLGILAFHMLEPESLDGVMSWGFMGESFPAGSVFPIRKAMTQVAAASVRVE